MSGSTYDDFNNNPRKQGASLATKIVLTLACVFGLACVACCGGVFYMGKKVADSVSKDPVKAREVAAKMTELKAPDSLKNAASMDLVFGGVGVRFVLFSDQEFKDEEGAAANDNASIIMLTEVVGSQDQVRPGMPHGGAQNFKQVEPQPFTESVVQKMTINGKETSFEIGKIKDAEQEIIQAVGGFKTKDGNEGNLILIVRPAVMDLDAAIAFVRSLGTPIGEPEVKVKAAPVEKPDASDAPEKATDSVEKPADANEKASDAPEKSNDAPDKSNDSNT